MNPHSVLDIRELSEHAYVLRIDRRGLRFVPGQHIHVGMADSADMREYSIYSADTDEYLEVLVKEIADGYVSRELHTLHSGDSVRVDGPFGFFIINEATACKPLVFVATGTGIAPFRCFARSYSGLDYTVLHGMRTLSEMYDYTTFESDRYIACVSGDLDGARVDRLWEGRVTAFLRESPIDNEALYYLCGSCDMIYEVFDILGENGVPKNSIFSEVYF